MAIEAFAWTTFGSGALVHEPGGLAGQQARGGGVGGRVGQWEADALEVVDPLVELDPAGRPLDRERRAVDSIAPVQRAPMCSRSSMNHSLVMPSASPIPPRIASAGTRTSVRVNWG